MGRKRYNSGLISKSLLKEFESSTSEWDYPEFIERILETSLTGIYIFDVNLNLNIFINSQYTNLTGWTLHDFNKMNADDFVKLFHEDDREAIFAHINDLVTDMENKSYEIEYRFKKKNGQWMHCLSRDTIFERNEDGKVGRFIGTFLDITDKKEKEKQKRRDEENKLNEIRLESLGVFAGGIAHDFNNILTGILGFTKRILKNGSANEKIKFDANNIMIASNRAKELIRQILEFSRNGEVVKKVVTLDSMLLETCNLLKASIPSTIDFSFEVDSKLSAVFVNTSKIQEVVLNICSNAYQAMLNQKGHIVLKYYEELVENETVDVIGKIAKGVYNIIEIEDDGMGIPADKQKEIFDPFYTTKNVGEGTGLGLAVVFGILKNHNANLSFKSKLGKGTAFKIYLPVSDERALKNVPSKDIVDLKSNANARILFIDDEEMLAKLADDCLSDIGYQVKPFTDGVAGLAWFKENMNECDLVITDQAMPHLSGIELSKEIKKISPKTPIIICTGDRRKISDEDIESQVVDHCLLKPYDDDDLANVINLVLNKTK